jgi:plasmid stability protein
MAETAGGLVKQSVQFTPEQMAWLQGRAAKRGQASVAAVVREVLDAAMATEQQAPAPLERVS